MILQNTMSLRFDNNATISSIQTLFNTTFPYLRIEFYVNLLFDQSLDLKSKVQPNRTLRDCRRVFNNGELEITPALTVSELVDCCKKMYGLDVQVLRQSGKVWLGTTLTENWTLEEQNKQGEVLSKIA